MDSSFSFLPLWDDPAIIYKPEKALDALHGKILSIVLKAELPKEEERFCPKDVLRSAFFVINRVMTDLSIDNELLNGIRATHIRLARYGSPLKMIDAALVRWYTEAATVLYSHQSVRSPDINSMPRGWAPGYRRNHPIANLGFMTILRGFEVWEHPKHPKLQAASLISKAALAILYATYTIGPHLEGFAFNYLSEMPVSKARELFLKVFVSISGNVYNDDEVFTTPPAFEFGATRGNVRICQQGKKLLVRSLTEQFYREAPDWHPYRRVPGSPWNNFIRNTESPVFSTNENTVPHTKIKFILPYNAIVLAGQFKAKYNLVRAFLQSKNQLPGVSEQARLLQLKWFAQHSGRRYAKNAPDMHTATSLISVGNDFLYYTPAIQKPRADSSGFLTLPFMSTAVHAIERHGDPVDTPIQGLLVLSFSQELPNEVAN
uniref:MAT1-1-2 protein n=1 Tax=Gibberella sacchari TaxID=42676 RepID=Q1JUJ9_GIBSA|nr:mating type protein MAT1-1-2 [Fusarium sacchari]BAE94380.1 MAT1-1-2 protein [Fusarium sacchari]